MIRPMFTTEQREGGSVTKIAPAVSAFFDWLRTPMYDSHRYLGQPLSVWALWGLGDMPVVYHPLSTWNGYNNPFYYPPAPINVRNYNSDIRYIPIEFSLFYATRVPRLVVTISRAHWEQGSLAFVNGTQDIEYTMPQVRSVVSEFMRKVSSNPEAVKVFNTFTGCHLPRLNHEVHFE